MPKVRFLEDVKTRTDPPQRFAAGSVHDLREDAANRWVLRNKAEYLDEADATPADPLKPAAAGNQAAGNARDGLPEGDPGKRLRDAADGIPDQVPAGPPVSPDGIIPPASDPPKDRKPEPPAVRRGR